MWMLMVYKDSTDNHKIMSSVTGSAIAVPCLEYNRIIGPTWKIQVGITLFLDDRKVSRKSRAYFSGKE